MEFLFFLLAELTGKLVQAVISIVEGVIFLGRIDLSCVIIEHDVVAVIDSGFEAIFLSKLVDRITAQALDPVATEFNIDASKRYILGTA